MAIQRPGVTEGDERIVKFRPRTLAKRPSAPGENGRGGEAKTGAEDLSRYEQDRARPDDYRHRMVTNMAAIAFTALLVAAGIWLAVKLADLRNMQDCVLMGRRDCAHISSVKE